MSFRKIAILTEGQTEQIFIREFLLRSINNSRLSFECFELNKGNLCVIPYKFPAKSNPKVNLHFTLINVQGDVGVLTSIKDREKNLIEKGNHDFIIGIRDMYSKEYRKNSNGKINDKITLKFIKGHKEIIDQLTYTKKIKLYFAIMEIEAWLLGMYNLYEKIDKKLTPERIKTVLGADLREIDPQKAFYKPSNQLAKVLAICDWEYKKKKRDVESICSKMEVNDLESITKHDRCSSFKSLYNEIKREIGDD